MRDTPPPVSDGPTGSAENDDFSYDVLSSARRSLVRGTPLSAQKKASKVMDSSPLKLDLDTSDDDDEN